MKLSLLVLTPSLLLGSASAFSFQVSQGGLVSVAESTPRDVYTMCEWAESCGVQKADGFEITSYDGQDYLAVTQQNVAAGTPVLFVPNEMMFTSSKAADEFGYEALRDAEQVLILASLQEFVPLFRVFAKILLEYEKGENSPWYHWLNSLPRLYNTGASMTFACFECLPEYASKLAMDERTQSVNFQKASRFLPIDTEVTKDYNILKWAYNVAVTRSCEWNGERVIAPMADMLNHGTETEVEVSYDDNGNCVVYASKDIPAGSPLRMSYGDPTNPSVLFASYGFLDETSPASFCKLMRMQREMKELGYDFSNLLFYKDTGDISMEVYDVVLYSILLKNDPNLAQGFYQAVVTGDEATKSQYHGQYFQYTKEELLKHVDGTLKNLDKFEAKARSYDIATHPRVPVILKHNAFVKETFWRVKQNLDSM